MSPTETRHVPGDDTSGHLPTVSAVVCAYTSDRWDDLLEAVGSLTRQTWAVRQIIVVIDHNDELLARAESALSATALVVANTHSRGLSGARNTAIEHADGELIAFLDDDASARPEWLAVLGAHFTDPRVVGAGALAVPAWPSGSGRPATLPAHDPDGTGELDWVVGCSYTGLPTSLRSIRNLMGCNMVIRASVFDQVGGFSEELGRVGRTPLGCEETELCIRARQAQPDATMVFDPATSVSHRVGPQRLSWRYLLSRAYAEGVSKAAVSRMVGQGDALETERGYVLRTIPRGVVRELGRAVRRPRHLASATAIAATVATTSLGYVRGRLARRRPVASAPRDLRLATAQDSP